MYSLDGQVEAADACLDDACGASGATIPGSLVAVNDQRGEVELALPDPSFSGPSALARQ
jgi:hypothetical protein